MILVTGGTGFVGEAIIAQARQQEHTVRVVCRDPDRARAIWRDDKGVEVFHGNILNASSLEGAFDGAEAVVHLVGIICESAENTFDRVHRQGTVHVVEATKRAKIKRYLHMSALGTRAHARSEYHKTKWAAEEAVRASGLEYTIFRPAVIYGKRDQSLNTFARMLRLPGPFPILGNGRGLWQPVPVEQVAACFVRAIREPKAVGKTYDLVGPTALSMEEVVDLLMNSTGLRRPKLHVPMSLARLMARASECGCMAPLEKLLGIPPICRDQLLMLEEDNVGDPAPAVADLGLQLMPLAEALRQTTRGEP